MEIIKVGISELNVTTSPNKIRTNGLGSCVGIIIYDKKTKIGGLAHIMLPYSYDFRKNYTKEKFADTAIPLLIEKMIELGANKNNLVSAIFGGANMFKFTLNHSSLLIGERNIESTKAELRKQNIPIKFEDLGGNKGRTITLDCETGIIFLKTITSDEKEHKF